MKIVEISKLPTIKFFLDGDWIESKDQDPNGEVRLIQLADIGMGQFIDKSSRYMTYSQAAKMKCNFLEEGDILIARMPDPIGRCCIFPINEKGKYVTVVDVCILRLGDLTDRNYVSYAINSSWFQHQIKSQITGTTRQRISRKKLGALQIPLPPLTTQKQIAERLDEAESLRKKTKAILAEYDQLAQAIFLDMFGDPVINEKGWEKKNIRKNCIKFCDGPFGSKLKSEHYVEKGVRVVRLQNIGAGFFINKDKAFITEEHAQTLLSNHCLSGDILIGTMGEPNLRACVLPEEITLAINKADCLICRPNEDVFNTIYLMTLLNIPSFVNSLSNLILGQTRGRISMGRLSTKDVLTPPLDLQNQFAEKITLIEEQKQLAEQSLQEAEDLFQCLLQEAFAPSGQ